MKRKTILPLIGVAAIMLVIGTALGSIAFPMTTEATTTTTQVRRNSTSVQPLTVNVTVTSYSTVFPIANHTITEKIDVTYIVHIKAYTSGTCSWVDATVFASASNSTEFPTINFTQSARFLNFVVTTTTVTLSGMSSTHTDTTITFMQSESGNASSVGCPTVV